MCRFVGKGPFAEYFSNMIDDSLWTIVYSAIYLFSSSLHSCKKKSSELCTFLTLYVSKEYQFNMKCDLIVQKFTSLKILEYIYMIVVARYHKIDWCKLLQRRNLWDLSKELSEGVWSPKWNKVCALNYWSASAVLALNNNYPHLTPETDVSKT